MTFNRTGIVLKVATKKTFENKRILLAEFLKRRCFKVFAVTSSKMSEVFLVAFNYSFSIIIIIITIITIVIIIITYFTLFTMLLLYGILLFIIIVLFSI